MKKIIFLFITVFLITVNSFSQSGWFWQNPLPQGNRLRSIYPVPGTNVVYTVGGGGTIMKSSNSGQNWIVQNSGTTQYLRGVYFTSEQNGWVVGNSGLILRTTNGGAEWIVQNSGTSDILRAVYFPSQNYGFAVGLNGTILKTSNGGNSWSVIPNTPPAELASVFFLDNQTGWVIGNSGLILKTTNSGINWFMQNSGVSEYLESIYFSTSTTGWIVGDAELIIKTTNGGNTWFPQNFSSIYGNTLYSVTFINDLTGFAVGTFHGIKYPFWSITDPGIIYKTINGGQNWMKFANIFDNWLYGISFLNPSTGYIVGEGGLLAKTTDTGNNWSLVAGGDYSTSSHNSVHVIDGNNVWVATRFSVVRTTNGGSTWNNVVLPNPYLEFSMLYCINNSTVFVAATEYDYPRTLSGLFKTTNSGLSWTYMQMSSYNDMFFVNDQTGWYVGSTGGSILKTLNGGQTWSPQNGYGNTVPTSVFFIDSQTGWITGNNSAIIEKTTDGGLNWNLQIELNGFFEDVYFINANTGWAVGGGYENDWVGRIYYTTNGGSNWLNQLDNAPGVFESVNFVNALTGWAGGWGRPNTNSILYKTTNGGQNWISQSCGSFNRINSIKFISNDIGWIAGDFGNIMKTTNGGIGINIISTEIPRSSSLYQNYPNPFNPSTNIKFDIPSNEFITLKIYNILGKEVATLVNEKLSAGSYEVVWDASGYISGVYFYRLEARDFVETKKMVLVK